MWKETQLALDVAVIQAVGEGRPCPCAVDEPRMFYEGSAAQVNSASQFSASKSKELRCCVIVSKIIRQRILDMKELLYITRKKTNPSTMEQWTKTMNKQFTENLNYH